MMTRDFFFLKFDGHYFNIIHVSLTIDLVLIMYL